MTGRARSGTERPCRWAAWACVALLAALSLTPGEYMVRTGGPPRLEHFVAYLGTGAGALAAIGYRRLVALPVIGTLLCAYAGLLEIGQIWVPGRHSQFLDFVASSAGVIAGIALARFWREH